MSKLRFWIYACLAILPVVAVHWFVRHSDEPASLKEHISTRGAVIPPAVRSVRPKYPHSVVPGGLYGPAELQAVTQKDALVREHYADFNTHRAQLVKLTDDEYQYVSFRIGNGIYWTKKKLRIPKGEILLTDGNNFARTRCGNRLSEIPKTPTTPQQPADLVLSLPPFQPEDLPQLSLVDGGPALPGVGPKAPAFIPAPVAPVPVAENWPPLQQSPGIIPLGTPPYVPAPHHSGAPPPGAPSSPPPVVPPPVTPPPVAPVPEPASACLLLFGLLISLLGVKRTSLVRQGKPANRK
ncbi:MAG: hypothetical protein JOY62_08985 [Acidobacteriaceae bacterium]|nr:hypothetical protein [Acidobacteriaceae bacterium]MBV9780094.1 hypothetical protein [Acidobacteriaceae bacterium]